MRLIYFWLHQGIRNCQRYCRTFFMDHRV